jgi:hypothetical protein
VDITKKVTDKILEGFSEGDSATKTTLGLTSPLWFAALLTFGVVEGVMDVAKGAVDSVGKLAGTVGDTTFQKIAYLEKLHVHVNPKGVEICVEFEGNVYKFNQAIALLKTLPGSDIRSAILYEAIEKAILQDR